MTFTVDDVKRLVPEPDLQETVIAWIKSHLPAHVKMANALLRTRKIWNEVETILAATEARVRAELQGQITSLVNQNTAFEAQYNIDNETIISLRATIAELEKRLENAVEIDWGNAPYWASTAKGFWAVADKTLHHTDLEFCCIPRPTPAKLTPEQMAEAWKTWWSSLPEARTAKGSASDALLGQILGGKSIETLYAEIGKGGAK